MCVCVCVCVCVCECECVGGYMFECVVLWLNRLESAFRE